MKAYLVALILIPIVVCGQADITARTQINHLQSTLRAQEEGLANLTGKFERSYWNDSQVPGLSVRVGGTAPTLVNWTNGLYAYSFAAGESVLFSVQLSHNYVNGSALEPHVHWSPDSENTNHMVWGLEYSWANVNESFPGSTTIFATNTPSGTNHQHQIASFASVVGTGKKISSILNCRLFFSTNATYSGEALLQSFDFHYPVTVYGSRQEYIK